MKRVKSLLFAMLVAIVVMFSGIGSTFAASTLPDNFTTKNLINNSKYTTVNYIKATDEKGKKYDYPIVVKQTSDGKFVYCLALDKTYANGIKYSKKAKVDDGFVYILEANLNTGDKYKDFYIKQLAVWYYMDYVNGNNDNLDVALKKYLIYHAQHSGSENHAVCKAVIDLLEGARAYKAESSKLNLSKNGIGFTIVDGYYVSSEIVTEAVNVSNIKYGLENTPKGTQVVKSAKGVIVKVPVDSVPVGKKLTFKLKVSADGTAKAAYYYYSSDKYQKLLYGEVDKTPNKLSDALEMTIANVNYTVNISKTDITQAKEVPGATLVVKDENGKTVESWVSTDKTHKMVLQPGKYTLTETIAPKGYKLSKTTISFMLDVTGKVYVKDAKGAYVSVDKVVMINELENSITVAKLDSETGAYVSGAKLAIKDAKGNLVKEFTSTNTAYSITLSEGVYTLSEVSAPEGYELSDKVVTFKLLDNGTVQVLEGNDYVDVAFVTFYNTKIPEVVVPPTGKNATLIIISGLALLIGGAYFAKKSIKEC